jgi:hypothetical protein
MINKSLLTSNGKKLIILLSCIIPCLLTFYWCFHHTQLPSADGSSTIEGAGHLYKVYVHKGFWHFVCAIYTDRQWRPVFFSVMMMPFMFVSKGDLFFSHTALSTFLIFIGTGYSYLLLNLRLNCFVSALGACLIGCLPISQMLGLEIFFIETALFPSLFALFYHLIKSDYLRSRKHSLAVIVALTLSLILRPIDSITHIALPFLLFCFLGWKNNVFSSKELKYSFLIGLIGITLIVTVGIHLDMNTTGLGSQDIQMNILYVGVFKFLLCILGLTIVLLNFSAFKNWLKLFALDVSFYPKNNYLLAVIFISTVLVAVWWMPFIQDLTEWTFQATLGGIAKGLTRRHGLVVISQMLRQEGILNFVVVGLAACIVFLTIGKKSICSCISSPVFYYSLAVVPLPLISTLFSVQQESRRVSLALAFFFLGFIQIALSKGRLFWLRVILLSFLLISQLVAFGWLFNNYKLHKNVKNEFLRLSGVTTVPAFVTYYPNPHDLIFNFLKYAEKKYHFKHVAVQIPTEINPVVDPFLMSVMINSNDLPFQMNYPYYQKSNRENELNIVKNHDALLLMNPFGKMAPSGELAEKFKRERDKSPPWDATTYDTLYLFATGRIKQLGWIKGPCYRLTVKRQEEACLFLQRNDDLKTYRK